MSSHLKNISTIQKLPFSFANRFKLVFSYNQQNEKVLYYVEPLTIEKLVEVHRVIQVRFTLHKLNQKEFDTKLMQIYQKNAFEARRLMEDISLDKNDFFSLINTLPEHEDLLESNDHAPIIKLINAIFSEAIKEGASDIHIETFEKSLSIRFRIDGVLRNVLTPNRKLSPLLVSRVKVMAKLDIAEKRLPQDGRVSLKIGGRSVDVRVSTLPSSHGERVVMRLLDTKSIQLNINNLGMTFKNQEKFRYLLKQPHGIILVTGTTGSGKSTTLYAGLQELNNKERNILTIEDPIEFDIDGIGQTQVNSKVEMTFARGLRAILRQDPDVVMVGEIRDLETAQIGVQASLTGHLVISTLHTNNAIGAITRLRDMGIETFLLSSSLLGILSQRLVRTLCFDCKIPYVANIEQKKIFSFPNQKQLTLYRSHGCKKCNFKGFKGRTGIHELLLVDKYVRELIYKQSSEQEIEKAIRLNTPNIQNDGLEKVKKGITSLEELMRVTKKI
ncbi:general secretion pathway protein E [Candidatus Photodesmus katoptron]|uniref:type II secretion system ATPase GspE n=1 Tax=Candidatus Photodesmus anomalopis TaxID=28176 RepID=UPI0004DA9609|nr:type II secretion system ATPase GspE [Candidatus Photodesmus katoptron]KEY90177.1 general secretion pathway protein E [Candidatus Photodesmus katoptron]